jgi:hypothetical protein
LDECTDGLLGGCIDGRHRLRWEDNIRMDLNGNVVGRFGVDASGSG